MQIKNYEDFKQYCNTNNPETAIIRCDLNIPSDVQDYTRIYDVKDTILTTLTLVKRVVLISHYKRPTPNIREDKYSLKNILPALKDILQQDILFIENDIHDINALPDDCRIILLDNIRYYAGETKNDVELAKQIAKLGDVYINDGFSVSHRSHASVDAVTKLLPSFGGISLSNTITELDKIINTIKRPYTAIIGGSKVSTKIDVLHKLSNIADNLVIVGAMANVFLTARGINMQKSMIEQEYVDKANQILDTSNANIILPIDFCCSVDISTPGQEYDAVPDGYSCFDIGRRSIKNICNVLDESNTIMWNGATGAFEFANFDKSSKAIAEKMASLDAIKVIGGGETVASIPHSLRDKVGFICTAGGAFLDYIAGNQLPGILALQK